MLEAADLAAAEHGPVAVLLRHAERGDIADGTAGYDVPLTAGGIDASRALGARIGALLRHVRTSPVPRCEATSRAIVEGAGATCSLVHDRLLGDPGVFVADGEAAWTNWQKWGNPGVIQRLVELDATLPGMRDPNEAVALLASLLCSVLRGEPGVYLFVTHDAILAPFVARVLGLQTALLPDYLESAVVSAGLGEPRLAFRGLNAGLPRAL